MTLAFLLQSLYLQRIKRSQKEASDAAEEEKILSSVRSNEYVYTSRDFFIGNNGLLKLDYLGKDLNGKRN